MSRKFACLYLAVALLVSSIWIASADERDTVQQEVQYSAAVEAQALPGQWNAASGTYTVTDASRAAMQTFFNVSPTEAQASSFSEP